MAETPQQYSARHLRIAIEKAKIAVMEAQEETHSLRFSPISLQEMLDAAFVRLDRAWRQAAQIEMDGRTMPLTPPLIHATLDQ